MAICHIRITLIAVSNDKIPLRSQSCRMNSSSNIFRFLSEASIVIFIVSFSGSDLDEVEDVGSNTL